MSWTDQIGTGTHLAGWQVVTDLLLWIRPQPDEGWTNVAQRGLERVTRVFRAFRTQVASARIRFTYKFADVG